MCVCVFDSFHQQVASQSFKLSQLWSTDADQGYYRNQHVAQCDVGYTQIKDRWFWWFYEKIVQNKKQKNTLLTTTTTTTTSTNAE